MKDLYRVLKVSTTASQSEIKDAYRKAALSLHPDRHDGCEIKSSQFKNATEAYQTLSDHRKRCTYDSNNNQNHDYNGARSQSPPRNYRKVYAPRTAPGFKTFDAKRHYNMHYGDGMLEEAMERILRRQQREGGGLNESTEEEYVSPLGPGFQMNRGGATGSRRKEADEYSYEEAFVDLRSSPCRVTRALRTKEIVTVRMHERRMNRINKQKRGMSYKKETRAQEECETESCVVM